MTILVDWLRSAASRGAGTAAGRCCAPAASSEDCCPPDEFGFLQFVNDHNTTGIGSSKAPRTVTPKPTENEAPAPPAASLLSYPSSQVRTRCPWLNGYPPWAGSVSVQRTMPSHGMLAMATEVKEVPLPTRTGDVQLVQPDAPIAVQRVCSIWPKSTPWFVPS